MIIIPIMLQSAIDGRVEVLNTMVIDNIGGTKSVGDYRVRMFRKQADRRVPDIDTLATTKPIREGKVIGHRRLAEPVGNLVAKALAALEYDHD